MERVDLSPKAVSQIINGKALYTPETALRFERVLGINASIWSSMVEHYQLFEARREQQRKLQEERVATWVRRFPVADLKRLKILPETRKSAELAEALFRFLGVSSIEAWENYTAGLAAAFRQSKTFTVSRDSVAVWLALAEHEADKIETEPFDKKRCIAALRDIRTLTTQTPAEFYPRMVELLSGAGVAFVVVPELKGCRISGATRWITPTKAMIALSLRYKRNDHFWFTFFHEAGHILLHGKKVFIHEETRGSRKEETEADEYAGNALIPKGEYRKFVAGGRFFADNIRQFAQQVGIHPGIVVGRLQHDGLLDYRYQNELKEKFDASIDLQRAASRRI